MSDWVVNEDPDWKVNVIERLSACDNRPGLKKIYVTVRDKVGAPFPWVAVRFDTEPSQGIAYDHPNVWNYTDDQGRIVWNHPGIPTRYMLFMEDDPDPLIQNIRTDLPNEYCKVGGWWGILGNRPINRPGIYSYRIEVQWRGDGAG